MVSIDDGCHSSWFSTVDPEVVSTYFVLVAVTGTMLVAVTSLVEVGVTVSVVERGVSMQAQILLAAAFAVAMKALKAEAGALNPPKPGNPGDPVTAGNPGCGMPGGDLFFLEIAP